jgi:glucose-1-phosphate thymidylyltransferase
MGTCDEVLRASNFVQAAEARYGRKIACLEEIALRLGLITVDQFVAHAEPISRSEYGRYLYRLAEGYRRGPARARPRNRTE